MGSVLDPSYGGCAFLRAAVGALQHLGAATPESLVWGVDLDPDCARYADGLVVSPNTVTADFLALHPCQLSGAPFRAIVGNPPYVRHHWLKGEQRTAARAAAEAAEVRLPATASVWAYFPLHSLSFLAEDGRLALLVPEAILQADYARPLWAVLERRFRRTRLMRLRERIFVGTDEPVVLVAGEGRGPGVVTVESIDGPEALGAALHHLPRYRRGPVASVGRGNGRTVPAPVSELLDELMSAECVFRVSDLAEVRIGLVTGANQFFVRSRDDVRALGIPQTAVHPVVPRTQWLRGLAFAEADHAALVDAGGPGLLISPADRDCADSAVRSWLQQGERLGLHRRHKCRARSPWYRVPMPPAPRAFATCSRTGAPMVVLNQAAAHCTNALHALTWRPASAEPSTVRGAAVGMLTSLTATWAELHGRRYGGGVLKIEPGALQAMPVPVAPCAADAFEDVDAMLRAGDEVAARALADRVVLREGLGLSARDCGLLLGAHTGLRRDRAPVRRRCPGA